MPLVPAKCPSCGGDMQIDGSRKEAFCPYCGTKFLVESAVNYYNTKNEYHIEHADIKVEDSSGLETRLKNAETQLRFKDYKKATALYIEIANQFADDYRGWWGVVRAASHEFTGIGKSRWITDDVFYALSSEDEHSIYMYWQQKDPEVEFKLQDLEDIWFFADRALLVAPEGKREELSAVWESYSQRAMQIEEKHREIMLDCSKVSRDLSSMHDLECKRITPWRKVNELKREIEEIKEKYKGWKFGAEIRWPRSYYDDDPHGLPEGFYTFEEWNL